MATKLKAIPDGFHTITPYISANDAAAMMSFLKTAFGFEQLDLLRQPDGRIMHATMRLGDSRIMISEACEQMGPTPANLYLYVEDVDALFTRAVDAGAEAITQPVDMFWGDRFASLKDGWGNIWHVARQIEVVSSEEVARRAADFARQMAAS
jgi:PhnB protein